MRVRPLQPDEVEKLIGALWVRLGREMAELDEFNALTEDVRTEAIAYHERALGDDHRTILVVIEDGEFVGFIYARRAETMAVFDREYDLHVIEIYVREGSRHQGVASTLLSEVEAWGPARECEHATLVVHVDNYAARSLYENNGFEETRTFYTKPLR